MLRRAAIYCFSQVRLVFSTIALILPIVISGQGDFCNEAIVLQDGVEYNLSLIHI